MMRPQEYAKAIVGAVVAALTALLPTVKDGVSLEDGILTAIAFLVAFGAVFAVENKE